MAFTKMAEARNCEDGLIRGKLSVTGICTHGNCAHKNGYRQMTCTNVNFYCSSVVSPYRATFYRSN